MAADRTTPSDRPNVVLINTDDLGYGDLSCYGATKLHTPNIDRLAQSGCRFTDAHAVSAVCTPSRYALLTGEYPFRADIWLPVFLRSPLILDPDQPTVASVMRDAGYATACIGKWHLGFGTETPCDWNAPLSPGPLECGFDYYFGVPVVNSHPPFVYVENHSVVGLEEDDPFVYGQRADTPDYPEKLQLDAIGGAAKAHAAYRDDQVGTKLAAKAVEWIEQQRAHPFLLYFATTHIHHPFTPAQRFIGKSGIGPYGDFILELDWMVGELTNALEAHGLTESTLIVFTSDNGPMLNLGGQEAWASGHHMNGDLLGFKFDAWEGGHRVPFITAWPGHIPSATVSDQLISNIDLLASLAAMVGRDLPAEEAKDSLNVLPSLLGESKASNRDHVIICPLSPEHVSIRKDEWMYISGQGGGGFTGTHVGDHDLGGPAAFPFTGQENSDIQDGRLMESAPPAQLYNLSPDLRQRTNLYREYPERVNELEKLLKATSLGDSG